MPILCLLAVALAIRCAIFGAELDSILSLRPELVTPLTASQRLVEGSFLVDAGLSMYDGDQYRRPPLLMGAYRLLCDVSSGVLSSRLALAFALIAADILTAVALRALGRAMASSEESASAAEAELLVEGEAASNKLRLLSREEKREARIAHKGPGSYIDHRNGVEVETGPLSPQRLPDSVAAAYMLHPFVVLSCGAISVGAFSNLFVVLTLLAATHGWRAASCLLLACSAYLDVYPIVLVVPVAALLCRNSVGRRVALGILPLACSVLGVLLATGASLLVLFMASQHMCGPSCGGDGLGPMLWLAYGWMLDIRADLTPNIGLFWYFFTEVFGRFRPYFLLILLAHPFVYVAPLSLQFAPHRPHFLALILMSIVTLFKPYPALGDMGLVTTMLLLHPRTIQRMRGLFFFFIGMALPLLLLPWMWMLTLIYNFSAGLFVLEILSAVVRRDRLLKNFLKQRRCAAPPSAAAAIDTDCVGAEPAGLK